MPSAALDPRVSILLPALNAARTLSSCLRSIARQTEAAWECVLVDDGSTDGTLEIARQWAFRDPRFRVIATPHRGLIAALNEGLRECRGLLVARMDADDLMHGERLAAQMEVMRADPGLAGVGCHVRLFPRRNLTARMRDYERWLNSLKSSDDLARDAFVECPIAHPSLMMRTSLMGPGYVDRGWPEDYDLILRMLAAGHRIGMVPRRLLSWRDGPRRLSRTHDRYAIERFTACKAHFLAKSFLTQERYILWGYGNTGRALRRALAELGKTATHIIEIKRGRLGQHIHGAPVIPPEDVPALRGRPLVVSVARDGPRAQIRAALATMNFVEGADYVCAA